MTNGEGHEDPRREAGRGRGHGGVAAGWWCRSSSVRHVGRQVEVTEKSGDQGKSIERAQHNRKGGPYGEKRAIAYYKRT